VVGKASDFNTVGAVLSGDILTIYTNWSPALDKYAGMTGINTADLFIDINCDGHFDYAIGLDTLKTWCAPARAGKVYQINGAQDYQTSQQIMQSYHYNNEYGGRYDRNNGIGSKDPQPVPVLATGDPLQNISVVVNWGAGDHGASNSVAIDLTNLLPELNGNDWSFVWGTGTCANDTIQGCYHCDPTPLPGALILLGAGLVRLAAYGRRRRILA
jgi:hypothetical protein